MSEHFGPFDQYKEVMLDDGGVFGLQPGQVLDVLEDGRVVIADAEVAEEEEAPAEDVVEAKSSVEPSDDAPSDDAVSSDAAVAFAEAQKAPGE